MKKIKYRLLLRWAAIILNVLNILFLVFLIDYRTTFQVSESLYAFALSIVPSWFACIGAIGYLLLLKSHSHISTAKRVIPIAFASLLVLSNIWVLFGDSMTLMEIVEDLPRFSWESSWLPILLTLVPVTTITAIMLPNVI